MATDAQHLYTDSGNADCSCPIHEYGRPRTVPCGIDFAHRVDTVPITGEEAEAIYQAHHSYMPSIPDINIEHYGILFDGQLMGAVTFRQPLLHQLFLWENPTGGYTRDRDVGGAKTVVNGGQVAEAARICIGVDMPNLASCGFAQATDQFIVDHADRLGLEWLLTFIRADHVGSMLKALLDRGWDMVGISEPRQAGNRPDKGIREWPKQRWLCELETAPTPPRLG